jgi:hypothetical protein
MCGQRSRTCRASAKPLIAPKAVESATTFADLFGLDSGTNTPYLCHAVSAFETAYRCKGIGIIARCFLYEDALNVRSCDGTAKERW